MCGRFHVDGDDEDLQEILNEINRRLIEKFGEKASDIGEARAGEMYPTNIAPVLISQHGKVTPVAMRWGFLAVQQGSFMVPYAGEPDIKPKPIINAKRETAYDPSGRRSPSLMIQCFRESLQKRRVVVPTSGFYEWTHEGKKAVDKYHFTQPGPSKLYLAGLYDVFVYKGIKFPHFTILTTAPNNSIKEFHDRMPVLLHQWESEAWLRGENVADVLTRVPFSLQAVAAA